MTDNLIPIEASSHAQNMEAAQAIDAFRNHTYTTVITSKDLARRAANSALAEQSQRIGMEVFLSEIDFQIPDSVDAFITQWSETEADLLQDLPNGLISPIDMKDLGHNRYPVFLFINPTNLSNLDEDALGSEDKSVTAINTLKRITKYGRVSLVITPDRLSNTGDAWKDVPEGYQKALKNPADNLSKMSLVKYLTARSGIQKLGLEARVENPMNVFTPTNDALEKLIVS